MKPLALLAANLLLALPVATVADLAANIRDESLGRNNDRFLIRARRPE